MIMLLSRFTLMANPQAARHAEVEYECAVIGFK